MPSIQSTVVRTDDAVFITVFVPGHDPLPASSDHPNFDAIQAALTDPSVDPEELVELFDVAQAVSNRFEKISDRVLVQGGSVYFDGEEIHSALTKQIVRFMDENADFGSLVNFFEKVQDNPNVHSREQLYGWLDKRDFTIAPSGDIVAYKGVAQEGDSYRSISSGNESVLVTDANGETTEHKGRIPNPVGATVEMARGLVHHDPSVGCHRGLHVGTFDYASSFSRGTVLKVLVNPRDVVSVPTDCDWAKVRTCKYSIVEAIDAPVSAALDYDGDDLDPWEDVDFEDDDLEFGF